MSSGNRIPLAEALPIAERTQAALATHCEPGKCVIAGSVRREAPTIGDLEIVCVPLDYEATPLFASGLALVVNQWEAVRGQLPCKYTKRILPGGLCLDLFMVDPRGFGLQLAIRTGSAEWSHKVLATSWVRAGFTSKEGLLRRRDGSVINTPDERRLFELIGIDWERYGDPVNREV